MSATDIIAAIALAVAAVSAGLAIVSLVLAFRESSRRDEEIGHLRREAQRREEQLSLLREQVAGEQTDRLRQQEAHVGVLERVPTSGSERAITYHVPIQNTGAYIATDVAVELVDGTGVTVGTGTLDRALIAGESAVVDVETPPRDSYTGPYRIAVVWVDGRGATREMSSVRVGAP